MLGYGIFTTDGSQWKASRDLLRPQFKHIGQDALPEVQEVVEDFVGNIQTLAKAGVVDMQPLFFRLTLDTTMAVLFGRSLDDGTRKRDAEAAVFAKAFDDAQHMLARRGRLGDLYWLLDSFAFRRSCATVHRFVDDIVADALAEKPGPEKAEKAGGRYVFLKTLIARTRDPIALRDQCINVLLAGRDTTACLLSWTMFFLSRNPDVQQRLREECFGLASRADGDLPTANELDRMPLLRNTLKEGQYLARALRLHADSSHSPAIVPFRPCQLADASLQHDPPHRRRPSGVCAHLRPGQRGCRLQRLHHAPTPRSLRRGRARVPARPLGRR